MTHTYAVYKRSTSGQRHTETESEGLETNIPSKWTGKKARVAILISDKIDFQRRAINRDPGIIS